MMEAQSCRSHFIARNFVQPRGLLGWVAGQIMARRESNRQRNRWTLEQLGIEPRHHVLEIGCGPGWALSLACDRARDGFVVGVDLSSIMLAQARKRNRMSVRSGKLTLVQAGAEQLPEDLGGPFDRVYSSNVFGFLEDPTAAFRSVRSQMNPGARLATTWMPRIGPKTEEAVLAAAEQIERQSVIAGLTVQGRELRQFGRTSACCVIAALAGA